MCAHCRSEWAERGSRPQRGDTRRPENGPWEHTAASAGVDSAMLMRVNSASTCAPVHVHAHFLLCLLEGPRSGHAAGATVPRAAGWPPNTPRKAAPRETADSGQGWQYDMCLEHVVRPEGGRNPRIARAQATGGSPKEPRGPRQWECSAMRRRNEPQTCEAEREPSPSRERVSACGRRRGSCSRTERGGQGRDAGLHACPWKDGLTRGVATRAQSRGARGEQARQPGEGGRGPGRGGRRQRGLDG